jgi:hypothetical protein
VWDVFFNLKLCARKKNSEKKYRHGHGLHLHRHRALKRSCTAVGLSDSGTKAELWVRLKGLSGDKNKTKKPAPAADTGPPASFVAKEYAHLKIAGLDDEEEINYIINRRWSIMQEMKKSSDSDGGDKVKAKSVTEEVEPVETLQRQLVSMQATLV